MKMEECKMKKTWQKGKRMAFLILALCMGMCAHNGRAEAATSNKTISLDGNWTDGNCAAEGDVGLYAFTTTAAGKVAIEVQGMSLSWADVSLQNKDMTKEYWSKRILDASISNPVTVSESKVLEAGIYVIKITPSDYHDNNTGTYRVKGSFTALNNNETEPNNTFAQAQGLAPNQSVTGVISEDDALDFYSFTITQKQRVKVDVGAYMNQLDWSVWDKNYKCINEGGWYFDGNESTPGNKEYTNVLEAGMYYIKISKANANNNPNKTGKYTLGYSLVTPVTGISLPSERQMKVGESMILTAAVIPDNASNPGITWQSDDSYVASVDANGRVMANKPGEAVITAISLDDGEIKASCTIEVNPKKVHLKKVKRTAKKTMKVVWRKQANITGYQIQYGKKSNLNHAKIRSTSSSSTVAKFKVKKKGVYYVRVRSYYENSYGSYYGEWSRVKKVKISR